MDLQQTLYNGVFFRLKQCNVPVQKNRALLLEHGAACKSHPGNHTHSLEQFCCTLSPLCVTLTM